MYAFYKNPRFPEFGGYYEVADEGLIHNSSITLVSDMPRYSEFDDKYNCKTVHLGRISVTIIEDPDVC